MTDTRSPNEIEREIERERADLARTVDELQDRISPDRIFREIGRGFSEHGGDMGRAISRSVKQNPVALALTGIGLAWMMSGRSWSDDDRDDTTSIESPTYGGGARRRAEARVGAVGEPSVAELERHRETLWLQADDDLVWDDDDEGRSWTEAVSEGASSAASSLGSAVKGAGSGISSAVSSVAGGVSSAAGRAGEGISGAAGQARDGVVSAKDGTADRARRIRERLSHGTESLSAEARDRVVRARWQAVKARRAAARRAGHGVDGMARFIDENPLVAGALALAAGAAVAGALPRTRQEDDLVGSYSDRAYDRAERIFHDEKAKAMKVAERALGEASDIADETVRSADNQAPGSKSALEHGLDRVREGAERVGEAARDEAKRQDIGGSGG